jgi:SAM-dependent methyltransferase
MMTSQDYRNSHIGDEKAKSYHNQFIKNPYRSMVWGMEKDILKKINENYYINFRGTHLDFACGSGRITGLYKELGWDSTGIDISSSMLEIARKECVGVKFIEGDITVKDDLNDKKFDAITAFRFFPNAQQELRDNVMMLLVKKLKPSGILIFNNHKNSSSIMYRIGGIFRKKQHSMSEEEVKLMLKKCRLYVVQEVHLGIIPATNKIRFLPINFILAIENFLKDFKFAKSLSSNNIYVCKRLE